LHSSAIIESDWFGRQAAMTDGGLLQDGTQMEVYLLPVMHFIEAWK
jgi:hypothetical protein